MQAVRKFTGLSFIQSFFRHSKYGCSCLLSSFHKPMILQNASVRGLHIYSPLFIGKDKRNNKLLTGKDLTLFPKQLFHEDRVTKAVTVWGSIKELRLSPVPALVYGASGLIPFVAAPGYMILTGLYMPNICFAQMAYGATILSFLGGVRWGYSVAEESVLRPDWINLGASVVPSLVAWVGLMIPHPGSLFLVMTGIAGAGYYDMVTWGYPPWFKGLRFVLTIVAVLSLWTTFMCRLLLKNQDETDVKSEAVKETEE